VVADEALQPPDRHGLHLLVEQALAFALRLLRADPPADRRQQVGFVDHRQRAVEVADEQVADEARDVDAHGTAGDARRLGALDAALGFGEGVP
jgi:hypothetical protein